MSEIAETTVERRLRLLASLAASYDVTDPEDNAAAIHAGREAIAALKKLTNEVTAMLSMAEQVMRSHAGNTNVTVLIQRRDEASALLARCEAPA